ncbi:MAG: contractile injection system tape measure protein, partial [Bacteroidota bacterium]
DRTMRSFREIILSSIYRKSDFKIRKLVNKLYAAIRNNEADCLFSLTTFSLPVYGNINNDIKVLESTVSEQSVVSSDQESEDKEVLKKLIKMEKESVHESLEDPLFLRNAGLVLLHPYLGHLFDRVGLFEDGDFRSLKARKEAAIYLNYILLNDESYDEENLTLNKILCGLNVDEIIDFDLEITDAMRDTASGMLDAFIAHWTKISNSTHDGVRGGWLWREGKLLVKEDSFELTVEQKAYDILMDQLPFSLSHITYSWMKKPLYVIWR